MKKTLSRLWLLIIFAFLYAPIVILTVYSFTDSTMIGSFRGFSLQNYVTLFTTEELISMIMGTVSVAVAVAVFSTIIGTAGAIGAFYGPRRARKAMEFLNHIPVANADVVTGFSICILLIVFFRIPKDSFIPLLVGLCVLSTPFVYLSVYPRLVSMDPHLYEAALDLGATPHEALRKVVLRELAPGIVSGFLTSITLTVDDYFVTTYTKPADFDTISTYVVNATKGSQTEIKTALWALSAIIFLIVVAVVIAGYVKTVRAARGTSVR
ncbi:MAG: ABC transporter permease subunit [Eubacterium sp.]|nr:ABC transporter permease subunit [Eubacterium sp.]